MKQLNLIWKDIHNGRKVQEIFYEMDRDTWGSEARAAGPLYKFVDIASDYVRHKDYASAPCLTASLFKKSSTTMIPFDGTQKKANWMRSSEIV